MSSSTTRNAAGGANVGRKEGRANGLYAWNSASRAGRERSERERGCAREKKRAKDRKRTIEEGLGFRKPRSVRERMDSGPSRGTTRRSASEECGGGRATTTLWASSNMEVESRGSRIVAPVVLVPGPAAPSSAT